MAKVENKSFRRMRWIGFALTVLAWFVFLVSFFLPAAVQIGSLPGGPLALQSGWQTFVDTLKLSITVARDEPFALLCLLSPALNGLMFLMPVANLCTKHYAVFYGMVLLIMAISAIWICAQVYVVLNLGYYLWIGSILATALGSFLISGSCLMEDNAEHERLLAELKEKL